jgi:hypothetical protein
MIGGVSYNPEEVATSKNYNSKDHLGSLAATTANKSMSRSKMREKFKTRQRNSSTYEKSRQHIKDYH